MNYRLFILLKLTIALPFIVVPISSVAINVGQSKQLVCERLAIRSLSCHHQTVHLFGLTTSIGESFSVQAASVEEYHPNSEVQSYKAYRLALTGLTGKDFFYYKNNVQQAYADLNILNHLLSGSGASSLELRYDQSLLKNVLLLILVFSVVYLAGIILPNTVIFVFVLWIEAIRFPFRGFIASIIKSIIIALSVLTVVLTVSVTLWSVATIVQSEQLVCKLAKSNILSCEHRITYLFGAWSTFSKFNVQRAFVKESYSNSDEEEPSYNLYLTASDGKEICYACYSLGVRKVYLNLNKLNAMLNTSNTSTLDLNYERSWATQLLALIGGLTVLPFRTTDPRSRLRRSNIGTSRSIYPRY